LLDLDLRGKSKLLSLGFRLFENSGVRRCRECILFLLQTRNAFFQGDSLEKFLLSRNLVLSKGRKCRDSERLVQLRKGFLGLFVFGLSRVEAI